MRRSTLLAVLLLAAFLRFYRIDAQSFWNDEGNSARLAERSVQLIVEGAAGDIHPPGYYLLLAAWRAVVGHSEFALRGLSAFAGIILVALVYRLGQQYFDAPAALCAAFFAAIHPALIYYSQEARMYALVATLAAGLFVIGELVIRELENWRLKAALTLTLAAGLYTHYSFAFVIISINLLFLIYLTRSRITNNQLLITNNQYPILQSSNLQSLISSLCLPQLLALLLFSPWLPIAIRQVTSWPAGREYASLAATAFDIFNWLATGPVMTPLIIVSAVTAINAAVVVIVRWRWRAALLWVWLAVPVGLTATLGLFSPTFAKFLIVAVPSLCLLLGGGLTALFSPARQPLLKNGAALLIAGWILTACLGLVDLYFNPAYARADYRGIARYIDSIARPRDAILLNAPNQWEVFTYYHPDTANVFPVATSRPLNAPQQIAELESIAAVHDRLFVIYWGEAQSDPGRVIESWLNEETFKAYDQWYGDVRLAAYAVPRAATELQTRTDVAFGDRIVLDGYSLNSTTFSPGDIPQLTLFWRATSPITARYKVFVHLVGDPAQPPVAQHDGEPGGGLALTTTWQTDQIIADNHGVYLPLDLPPGDYSLVVGLYGVDDGVRLTHADGDSLLLSTVIVE